MNVMIYLNGDPDEIPFLPEIAALGAGVELQGYGMLGVQSERAWGERFALHRALRGQFRGAVAVHGPFLGMEYAHVDHLIREVVNRRLDMTFDVAVKLKASRVILHSGYKPEVDVFKMRDSWLKGTAEFWRQEIRRWADAGIGVVIENSVEPSPDLQVRLADEVGSPSLGLCLDVGHQHLISKVAASEWVRKMGRRLRHVHLHDNDRSNDHHWPLGRGSIDFETFFSALTRHAPQATVSLEVEDTMDVRMGDLRKLASRLVG